MSLSVGDHLGRFEILGSLGAGGMGEVYRARDNQLQRDVAIKVLPAAFSINADRRRRFEAEARAAGSLSHPNILAVHDFGVEGTSPYIVTELLSGETLRERIGGRPMPPRKVIEYAVQIASGLAAGHEHGIVHRDIKPDNLFVTTEGRIKILDFGLAKFLDDDSSNKTETITIDGVQRTPVLGTVAYMSPEQARGLRVDHRSDIFSLGAVIYEMLSGYPPFRRPTTADTVNAILNDEPQDLPAFSVTPGLDRVVRHCLEKKPDERFQSVRDLAFDLESRQHTSGVSIGSARARRLSRRVAAVLALVAAVAGTAAVGYVVGTRRSPVTTTSPTYSVLPMSDLVGLEEFPAISPDGKQIVFTAESRGHRQVFVRQIGGGSPLAVTTDDADHQFPRWSAKGNWLVFFSPAGIGEVQGTIWKVPALGGSAVPIMTSIGGADVNGDDRIAVFRLQKDQLDLVSAQLDGSDVRVIASFPKQYYRYPRWSPDATRIAFQSGDGFRSDLWWVNVSGEPKPTQLTKDRRVIDGLSWLPDGSGLVYASSLGSTIPYLPPLSLWEVHLADGVSRRISSAETWYEQPDVHSSGVVSAVRMQMRFDIYRVPFGRVPKENMQRAEPVTHQTGWVLTPSAAPDGKEIAFLSDSGGHANVWVTSPDNMARQITFEVDPTVAVGVPVWSPTGESIAYVSSRGNVGLEFGVWLVRPNGGEPRQILPKGLGVAWTPDGKSLYYVERAGQPLKRIDATGEHAVTIEFKNLEKVRNVIAVNESSVYFMVESQLIDGRLEFKIVRGPVGGGQTTDVKTIPASRVSTWQVLNPSLSPNGQWLALPLTDGSTTNVWTISTEDGHLQQVTDFGSRHVFIVRRVSWAPDGKSLYAAIGDGDADIVSLVGLVAPPAGTATGK